MGLSPLVKNSWLRPCVCESEVAVKWAMAIIDYLIATAQYYIHAIDANKILCRAFNAAGVYGTREPRTLALWSQWQETRWSNSVSVEELGPLSGLGRHLPQHIRTANSRKAGSAATGAELKK